MPNRGWASFASTALVTLSASSKVLIATAAPGVAGIDLTILRTRGQMISTRSTPAADQLLSGAFGMMMVTDIAAAAGVASIPGPGTDAGDDGWFVHEWILQEISFGTHVGTEFNAGVTRAFDSKGKRTLEDGQVIAVVAENLTASDFSFAVNLRCLDMVRGTG